MNIRSHENTFLFLKTFESYFWQDLSQWFKVQTRKPWENTRIVNIKVLKEQLASLYSFTYTFRWKLETMRCHGSSGPYTIYDIRTPRYQMARAEKIMLLTTRITITSQLERCVLWALLLLVECKPNIPKGRYLTNPCNKTIISSIYCIVGCPYGDRGQNHNCDELDPWDCYDKQIRDDCCETCTSHRLSPPIPVPGNFYPFFHK